MSRVKPLILVGLLLGVSALSISLTPAQEDSDLAALEARVKALETRLGNLITLCHFHHHLLHEGGFSLTSTDDGVFVFRRPDGHSLLAGLPVERRFRGSALVEGDRCRGVEVGPDAILTDALGETMVTSLAMDTVLRARETTPRESAAWPARIPAAQESPS